MANDSVNVDGRPSSRDGQAGVSRRERRKSDSKGAISFDIVDTKVVSQLKKRQSQDHCTRLHQFPNVGEEAIASAPNRGSMERDASRHSEQQDPKPAFRQPRLPQQTDGQSESTTA